MVERRTLLMANLTEAPPVTGLAHWLNASDVIDDDDLSSTFSTISNDTLAKSGGVVGSWENIVILVFKSIIMGSIILLSIMGNVLVIVSIGFNRKLHGITNYFLVSLAIADMLVALCAMTFNASVELSGKWLFGYIMCDLWNSFDVYFSTVSILHLCCISMDRYYAILNPLEYPLKMTKRKVLIMLAHVWLGPTLISFLPIFLGWYATSDHLADRSRTTDSCTFEVNKVFAILSSAISFWIPCTVMLILYYRIFQEARKQETAIMSRTNSMSAIHNIHRGLSPAVTIRKFLYNLKSGRASKNIFKSKRDNMRQDFPMCPITIGCNARQRDRAQSIYSATSDVQIPCGFPQGGSPCRCSYPDRRMPTPPCIITESEPEPMGPSSPVASIHGSLMIKDKPGSSHDDDDGTKETSLNNGHSGRRCPSLVSGMMPSSARTSTSHQLMIPMSTVGGGVPVMRREHKAARTLGIIMGAFILCWLPFFTWYVTYTICGEACECPQPVITTLFWIGYFNSTLNPFIYAYFRKDFREAFMKTLRRLQCCGKRDTRRSFV